jgi:hypothetical protein
MVGAGASVAGMGTGGDGPKIGFTRSSPMLLGSGEARWIMGAVSGW